MIGTRSILPRLIGHLGGDHRHNKKYAQPSFDSATKTAQNIPYTLYVTTIIETENAQQLGDNGEKLIGLIQASGLKLLLSAWDYPSAKETNAKEVHLLHLWDVSNDANNLLHAELTLPDEPEYAQFANLIKVEVKNLVVPATPVSAPASSISVDANGSRNYRYVYTTYTVPTRDLAEFVAFLEADTIPFGQNNGWTLGDSYIALTGDVRNLVQVWRVPLTVTTASAIALLRGTRWGKQIPDAQTVVYDPTPFDVHYPPSRN